jgi:hypothetical protein
MHTQIAQDSLQQTDSEIFAHTGQTIELTISLEIELGERKFYFMRIFASLCCSQSLFRDHANKMAVETVPSEPLSRPRFPAIRD